MIPSHSGSRATSAPGRPATGNGAAVTLEKVLTLCRTITVVSGAILSLFIFVVKESNTGILIIYLAFIALNALFVPFGLIVAVLRADCRRLALWVAGLPIAFLVVPTVIRGMLGFAFSPRFVVAVAIMLGVGAFVWGLARPQRLVEYLPRRLFTSRLLNVAIIALLAIGWLLGLAALVGLMNTEWDEGQGSPGMGAATVLVGVLIYFLYVGGVSFLAAFWGWLGLRGGVVGAQRKLHGIQLAVAAPGLLVGTLVAIALAAT